MTADVELEIPAIYYGGVERIVQGLIREYLDRGNEVILVAHTNENLDPRVKAYAWKNHSSRGIKNILSNSWSLLRIVIRNKPDVVHSFSRLLFLYPVFLFTRVRVVQSYGRYISAGATKTGKKIGGKQLQLTSCASHMLNHLPDKKHWKVISNFLELDKFTFREKASGDYLVFLGRIEDIKGTREAIEVAIQTNRKLIVAGNINEDQRDYYVREIEAFENHPLVSIIGPVNDEKKNELLGNAFACILPFKLKEEAFGLTIIESMATGTPVIALNIPAVHEIIKDRSTGFICNDVPEMIQAVSDIDQIRRQDVRRSIETHFTSTIVAGQYLQLFSDLSIPVK
jgi:glycosyltransferase involved in cell wall biosynthesis